MRNLVAVLLVGLVIYTIIDVTRSEPEERYGVSRALWILLIVVLPVIGSVVWLVARQNARARGAGGGDGGAGGGGSKPRPQRPGPRRPGPVAPDDDPEFLWRLEQQQRRAQGQRDHGTPGTGGGGGTPRTGPSDAEGDPPGHGAPGPLANP